MAEEDLVEEAVLEDLEEEEMNMEPNTQTMSPFLPLNAAWSSERGEKPSRISIPAQERIVKSTSRLLLMQGKSTSVLLDIVSWIFF